MPCHLTKKSEIKGKKGHHPPNSFSPFVNTMLKDDANCECHPIGFFNSRGLWVTQKSLCMYFIIIIPKSKWRWVWIIFSHILIWSCGFIWWCGGCLFTGSVQDLRKDICFDGVFLKNFELNNRVFLGAGWGINETLIISILAYRNEAQPK